MCKKIILLLLLLLVIPSQAKIGYKVDVTVDGNAWYVERSTTNLTFVMKGFVKGDGESLRQQSIKNLAGLRMEECSHSKNGKLSIIEDMIVIAKEGAYEVDKQIENNSANIKINENWPTFMKVNRLVSYSGKGISNSECFENNRDVVKTTFRGKKMVKLTSYTTNLMLLLINAKIKEDAVEESVKYDKFIEYKIKSGLSDGKGSLCYRIRNLKAEEDYYGNFAINKNIKYIEKIERINATKTIDWLNCTNI